MRQTNYDNEYISERVGDFEDFSIEVNKYRSRYTRVGYNQETLAALYIVMRRPPST